MELVRKHNEHHRCRSKPSGRINLDLRPVPYIGNPNASVVLLTLNPSDKEGDLTGQSNDIYEELSKRNLRHNGGYYYLDPRLPPCPGKSYAQRQLKEPLKDVAFDALYNGVFLAQYAPYHSNEYVDTGIVFPSQHYTFGLISEAVRRGAVVVVLRSLKLWCSAVPTLTNYQNFFECSNPRAPTVSRRSLPDAYSLVINTIESARSGDQA